MELSEEKIVAEIALLEAHTRLMEAQVFHQQEMTQHLKQQRLDLEHKSKEGV